MAVIKKSNAAIAHPVLNSATSNKAVLRTISFSDVKLRRKGPKSMKVSGVISEASATRKILILNKTRLALSTTRIVRS